MRISCVSVTAVAASILLSAGNAHASWEETLLFSFKGTDGAQPDCSLIADQVGNLYGTTSQGGPSGNGLVFKLTRPAAGKTVWTETVLASFNKTNGAGPVGGLVLDKAGNLSGTTTDGGPAGDGTVFKLTPPSGGKGAWKHATLLAFTGINGIGPHGSLTLDAAGNLYGAAAQGGQFGHGAIFTLMPPAAGKTAWSGKVLFSFNQTDGAYPNGGLVFDKMGNLYGTTASGTTIASYGTVFRLSPPAAGKAAWTETTLFDFDKTDGANPDAGVILDAAGLQADASRQRQDLLDRDGSHQLRRQ